MRTMLLYPSSAIPDNAPIEQIRLPWNIRRILAGTGLKTVGDVRKSTNEVLLRLGLDRGVVDYIRETLGSLASIELKLGDRVRLSELGVSRSPKIKVHTGVVALPPLTGSASIGNLFDGNKRATRIHCTYVEIDDRAKAK
jgi:hypothetical protein